MTSQVCCEIPKCRGFLNEEMATGVSIVDQVKRVVQFREPPWENVSSKAKDFVASLLTVDEHKRLTAQQALLHPWLKGLEKIGPAQPVPEAL